MGCTGWTHCETRSAANILAWKSAHSSKPGGMLVSMQLERIQQEIRNQKLDGWLFFDHHVRDPLAYRVLGFTAPRTPTRRWYYLIPAQGEPRGLVHRIESGMIDALPGEKTKYSSWTEQVAGLKKIAAGCHRVAMQYSP